MEEVRSLSAQGLSFREIGRKLGINGNSTYVPFKCQLALQMLLVNDLFPPVGLII